ncbi:hypothetical protein [Streptomyces acidiscabies]|uniref:Uncharacterized protein n=1 Tax=Streptomyces acidiscabies TaxID=42234 RepID=A0ABU4LYQ4_9ACTN|nr:hypothetical protein [Streptomyces acidiscabies]MDX3020093.1 hypothetical protein [Streptomyces acidiscabies]
MPNHKAVVDALTQDVVGPGHHFNGARGEVVTMPTGTYEDVQDAMAAVLERVAVAVDWRRLLVEAAWRHLTLHPDHKEDLDRYVSEAENVCGECLAEALLQQRSGAPDWEREPSVEMRHQEVDWAAVVADALQHRRGAIRHRYRTPHRAR